MTVSRNLTEAQRWLKQASHDREAARLNRDHGFHDWITRRYLRNHIKSAELKRLEVLNIRLLYCPIGTAILAYPNIILTNTGA